MIIVFLIILGLLGVLGECYIISLWIIAYRRTKKRIFPSYSPLAYVIVPCKGIEHGFHQNIQAFLTQEYTRYELIFVVDSQDDPAYKTLNQIINKKPNAHIVLTNPVSGCSGKVAALLTGLESTTDAEVLVFADSDIKPDTTWLQNLILPLQDESIGATTGYRWYFPSNWKTMLISAWNMTSIVFMFYPSYTFAWGDQPLFEKRYSMHLISKQNGKPLSLTILSLP